MALAAERDQRFDLGRLAALDVELARVTGIGEQTTRATEWFGQASADA